VNLSELAKERASDAKVKDFAAQMVTDHTQAGPAPPDGLVYLQTLCREAGEEFAHTLCKARASKRWRNPRENGPQKGNSLNSI